MHALLIGDSAVSERQLSVYSSTGDKFRENVAYIIWYRYCVVFLFYFIFIFCSEQSFILIIIATKYCFDNAYDTAYMCPVSLYIHILVLVGAALGRGWMRRWGHSFLFHSLVLFVIVLTTWHISIYHLSTPGKPIVQNYTIASRYALENCTGHVCFR